MIAESKTRTQEKEKTKAEIEEELKELRKRVSELEKSESGRKMLEEALKGQEEEFKCILENFIYGFFIFQDGKAVYVNSACCEIFGCEKEEIFGRNLFNAFVPEERHLIEKILVDGLLGIKEQENYVAKGLKKNGEIIFIELSSSEPFIYKNKPAVLAVIRNITERKRADDALKESERKYSTLAERGNDGIVIVQDGLLKFVNSNMREITGFSAKEFIGKQFIDFISPEYRDLVMERYKKRLVGKEIPNNYEIEILTKDGGKIPVEVNAGVIEYERKLADMAIIRDITERKKAEEDLKESEEKFRNLAEQLPSMVFIASTRENGRIIYVNRKFEEVLGYTKEEFYSPDFHFMKLIAPEYAELVKLNFSRHVRGEEVNPYEYAVISEEGKRIEAILSSKLVKYKGDIVLIGVINNITEQKQIEEKIKASLKEKEVLLSEIHHRVKNNLQVISSLLNMQSKFIKDNYALEILKETRNRVKTMSLIHEKLYQSSSMESIDFGEYIQKLAAYLFNSYAANPDIIKIRIDAEKIFLNVTTAIPCGLIVNELVSNSLKHAFPSGREGEIYIKFRLYSSNKFLLIVKDDGVGIPKEMDFKNTESLGLKLVVTLTNQLCGDINLDRSAGTLFRIIFTEQKNNGIV